MTQELLTFTAFACSEMQQHDVVLKLYGKVSAMERALAAQYARAVEPHGQMSVLYDLGSASSSSALSSDHRASLPSGIRKCFFSFQLVKSRFPEMERRFAVATRRWRAETRRHMFVARNFNVEAPLVMMQLGWLEGCPKKAPTSSKFLWAIEADAAFHGDVRSFFDAFRSDPSDLLATGYTIVDHRWWAMSMSTLKRKPQFNRSSIRTHSLPDPLQQFQCGRKPIYPSRTNRANHNNGYYSIAIRDDIRWGPGQCNATGAVFRLTNVERYSAALIDHLSQLLSDGRFSSSEAYASTACAFEPWCVLGDWAALDPTTGATLTTADPNPQTKPNPWAAIPATTGSRTNIVAPVSLGIADIAPGDVVRGTVDGNASWLTLDGVMPASGFRSAQYFYYPARYSYVASWCDVCDCKVGQAWQNRWVHPVAELKSNLRTEHPIVFAMHRRSASVKRCLAGFPGCSSQCGHPATANDHGGGAS